MALRFRRALVVTTLVVVSLALSGCGGDPVPDIIGQRYEAAEFLLQREGFRVGRVEYDANATGPVGCIIRQNPRAESLVIPGDDVDIVIAGPQLVRVPMLIGGEAEEARSSILDSDLRRGRVIEVYHDYIRAGTVVSQALRPGSFAPKGTKVEFTVSLGPKDAPVPGIVGRWEDDARDFLFDVGFSSKVEREDSRQPEGVVIEQWPDARTELELGKKVKIVVSRGPEYTAVPDVLGLSVAEARRTLRAAGMDVTLRTVRGTSPEDADEAVVRSQQPVGGYRGPAGLEVVVFAARVDR